MRLSLYPSLLAGFYAEDNIIIRCSMGDITSSEKADVHSLGLDPALLNIVFRIDEDFDAGKNMLFF